MVTSIINDFLTKETNILHIAINQDKIHDIGYTNQLNQVTMDLSDPDTFYSPIAPFMCLLKNEHLSDNEILYNTYLPQQKQFMDYLKFGIVYERPDVLILKEKHYEQLRCFETIATLLNHIKEDYIFILNSQNLGNQAIDFIDYLHKNKTTKKIICIYAIEELPKATSRNIFFANITESTDYYEVDSSITKTIEQDDSSAKKTETHNLPVSFPNEVNANFFIHTFQNSRAFYSYNESHVLEHYLTSSSNSIHFTSIELATLYYERAAFEVVLGSLDEAIFYLNSALEKEYSQELYYKIILTFSVIYFAKSNYENSLFYARSVTQKAADNSIYFALASMLILMASDRSRKTTTEAQYERVQELLAKFHLENNRVYSALYFPKANLENIKHNISNMAIIEKVISDCKKIGNDFALSGAYQWKSIFLEKINKSDALNWQKKCYDIRLQIGDILSIIKSNNGLSYEYFLLSDYLSAYNMLNDLVNRVFTLSDNDETVISFYNLAKILFFGKNFNTCYLLVQKVLRLMKIYNIKDFFFCKENDSILLKGIIDFYKGEYTKAQIALHNVESNGKEKSVYIEALVIFLKALLCLNENNNEEAIELVQNIESYTESLDHEAAFIYFEFAYFLNKKGLETAADVFFEKGQKISTDKELVYYIQNYCNKDVSTFDKIYVDFPKLSINLDSVESIAQNQKLIDKAQKKIQEARFIDNITSLGFRFQDLNQYIQSFCKYFVDFTLAKSIFVAQKKGNQWFCIGSYTLNNTPNPTEEHWDEYNALSKDTRIYELLELGNNKYYIDISIYDLQAGLIIQFSEDGLTKNDNYEMIKNAISHLQSVMTIFYQNENLQRLSTTDQLTTLYNRRAMEIKMAESEGILQRFSNNQTLFVAITFIDLDNFKFFNDTYGHKAGDYILLFFSELLRKIYRKIDYICRFGGDEFVILSTDAKIPNPVCAVDRLRKALYEEECFIPKLESVLKTTLQIPQEQLLGFSAGICTNLQVVPGWNMDTVLQNADKALYKAKQTGKNRTQVWDEENTKVI